MGDIKVFRIDEGSVTELEGQSVTVEKSLQALVERHLDTFVGVRFLASEHFTGKVHGGRIDTLGIDENGSPVIIEYKRALNENVINQGLFYLDWLMDHQAEFTLLVMQRLGQEAADNIDWSTPRLICIAGNYTRYDEYAIKQMDRNIDLMRYRRYGDELLLLELVNTSTGQSVTVSGAPVPKQNYKTVQESLDGASSELQDLFETLKATLLALGEDVQMKTLKFYFAFKRIKNFACVEVYPQAGKLLAFVKVNPDTVQLEEGFTRDVRSIGHLGTGDLEITLRSVDDLERAQHLLVKSYEVS